jgi:hypothetical protein
MSLIIARLNYVAPGKKAAFQCYTSHTYQVICLTGAIGAAAEKQFTYYIVVRKQNSCIVPLFLRIDSNRFADLESHKKFAAAGSQETLIGVNLIDDILSSSKWYSVLHYFWDTL